VPIWSIAQGISPCQHESKINPLTEVSRFSRCLVTGSWKPESRLTGASPVSRLMTIRVHVCWTHDFFRTTQSHTPSGEDFSSDGGPTDTQTEHAHVASVGARPAVTAAVAQLLVLEALGGPPYDAAKKRSARSARNGRLGKHVK